MKRDMELIKKALLIIEENEDDRKEIRAPENVNENDFVYHLQIMEQAGFTKNKIQYADNKVLWIYSSLTWDGHEFLGAIKNETVWRKVKEKLGSEIVAVPLTVIASVSKELALKWAKNKLGLGSGE